MSMVHDSDGNIWKSRKLYRTEQQMLEDGEVDDDHPTPLEHFDNCGNGLQKEHQISCTVCHTTAKKVQLLFAQVLSLKQEVETMAKAHQDITEEFQEIKLQNNALRRQNETLQSEVQVLCQQIEPPRKSLVIGDSLLKSFDESKLENVTVLSMPGAKISQVSECLQLRNTIYGKVCICIGTNDCSKPNFSCTKAAQEYCGLIEVAKSMSQEVVISSIPPRTDYAVTNERVKVLNGKLRAIAMDTEVNFIDNDPSFTLEGGAVKSEYLQPDGLHLSPLGANQLAYNLGFTHEPQQDVCQSWRPFYLRPPGKVSSGGRQVRGSQRMRGCWFCGERNHNSDSCRFKKRVLCSNCGELGHKAKLCRKHWTRFERLNQEKYPHILSW